MARRTERDVVLADAERAAEGLHIGVRLRVAIELLRSLSAGAASVRTMPRAPGSRLSFDRVAITQAGAVYAIGDGDTSGAALALWEILAGKPLGADGPSRLHDVVDDMPPDVDDLVMSAIGAGADAPTAAELHDELVAAAEPYAVDALEMAATILSVASPRSERPGRSKPSVAPGSARRGAGPTSTRAPSSRSPRPRGAETPVPTLRPTKPSPALPQPSPQASPQGKPNARPSTPPAPPSKRTKRSVPPVASAALAPPASPARRPPGTKTSGTLQSMKAVSLTDAIRDATIAAPIAPTIASTPPPEEGWSPPPSTRPASSSGTPGSSRSPASRRASQRGAELGDHAGDASVLLLHAGEQATELADALRHVGYEVVVRTDGASGFAYAVAHTPMCILCDSDLPDAEGEAIVRRLRAHPSPAAHTPFMLFASRTDTRRRIATFGAGADVCLMKPVRPQVVVTQVDALMDMSSRLRDAHRAVSATPQLSVAAACSGDIRQVGIGVMLTIFEMERRTGIFAATGSDLPALPAAARMSISDFTVDGRYELDLATGCVAGASAMGVPLPPVEVVRAMLRLTEGRFVFKPMKARYVEAPRLSEVLAEAARLEDEAAAARS